MEEEGEAKCIYRLAQGVIGIANPSTTYLPPQVTMYIANPTTTITNTASSGIIPLPPPSLPLPSPPSSSPSSPSLFIPLTLYDRTTRNVTRSSGAIPCFRKQCLWACSFPSGITYSLFVFSTFPAFLLLSSSSLLLHSFLLLSSVLFSNNDQGRKSHHHNSQDNWSEQLKRIRFPHPHSMFYPSHPSPFHILSLSLFSLSLLLSPLLIFITSLAISILVMETQRVLTIIPTTPLTASRQTRHAT